MSAETKCVTLSKSLNFVSLNLLMQTMKALCVGVSRSGVSNSFATPWIVACQISLSMEFSQEEYWSGVPFPSLNKGLKLELFLSSTQ